MTYRILYQGQPIGISNLEHFDSAMAVAYGTFHPAAAYEAVRPVFLTFTSVLPAHGPADEQKLRAYYEARDALGLSLVTDDGQHVDTGHIHIINWGPEQDGDLEVEVQVTNSAFRWRE